MVCQWEEERKEWAPQVVLGCLLRLAMVCQLLERMAMVCQVECLEVVRLEEKVVQGMVESLG